MGLSSIYKSMADETRLRILAILSRGSFNVGELTEILGAGQPNVSHHLKTLQSVGLVESHREGKWAFYKLSTKDPQRDVPTHVLQGFLTGLDLQNLPTSFDADRERMLQILQGRSARTRQYFDTVASSWQEIRDELHDDQLYVDRVSELIASADSLVELGCGAGHFLKHFLPRTGTTIAVDNSPEMLDRLRDTLGDLYEMVDPRLGEIEHLPLPDRSVDAAIANMVLHHIASPQLVLQDTHRVLRNGGRMIVVDLVRHENEAMRDKFGDLWLGFEPDELCAWARQTGFINPEVSFADTEREVFMLTVSK